MMGVSTAPLELHQSKGFEEKTQEIYICTKKCVYVSVSVCECVLRVCVCVCVCV